MNRDFKLEREIGIKIFFVTAGLAALLSIAPRSSNAGDDPRVERLISQSGVALHIDALRSIEVIHTEGTVVANGLSGVVNTM